MRTNQGAMGRRWKMEPRSAERQAAWKGREGRRKGRRDGGRRGTDTERENSIFNSPLLSSCAWQGSALLWSDEVPPNPSGNL